MPTPTLHDLGDPTARPRAVFINRAGPDNVNGLFVLGRLAAYLKSLADGGQAQGRLAQRVLIAPGVTSVGELPESARQAYYRIELDHAAPGMDALPQVCLYRPNDDERASACLFGLTAVNELDAPTADDHHGWDTENTAGERFLLVAGRSGELQPACCERLFRSLVAFMKHTGILADVRLAEEEDDLHYFAAEQIFSLQSESAGLFVFRQEPGQWLRAGDVLGYLYDVADGALLKEVKSPVNGLLAAVRRAPLVVEGTVLAFVHRS